MVVVLSRLIHIHRSINPLGYVVRWESLYILLCYDNKLFFFILVLLLPNVRSAKLLSQLETPSQAVENLTKELRDIPIGALNLWVH